VGNYSFKALCAEQQYHQQVSKPLGPASVPTRFGLPPTAVRMPRNAIGVLAGAFGVLRKEGFLARQDGTVPRAVLGHLGGFHARLEPGTCLPTGIPFPATEWHRLCVRGVGCYPNCQALYQVVKVEAGRETAFHDVTCLACGAPLSGRDGEFVVKYFLLRHGARRKLRRAHDSDPA
jgi:hypothetical protein